MAHDEGDVKYTALPPAAYLVVIEPDDDVASVTIPSLVVTVHPPLDDGNDDDARFAPGATPRPFSLAVCGLRYWAASLSTFALPVPAIRWAASMNA